MSSRIIAHGEFTDFKPWTLPRIEEIAEAKLAPASPDPSPEPTDSRLMFPTAEEIEEIQRQAHEEGFASGYQQGLAQARAEIAARVKWLEQSMATLSGPFAELDQQVEQELVALVIAIGKQMVRRELKTEPGEIVAVVREAMAALPVAKRSVQLHLHPEDAKFVREGLVLPDEERPWKIVEDPILTRGGCKVTTESSLVDATVEKRLAAVIARMLGNEREHGCPHS
jgi:flagellar assembly protein FliH